MNAAARWDSTDWTRQRGLRLLMGLALIAGLMVARAGSVEAVHSDGVNSFFELGPTAAFPTTNIKDDALATPDWEAIFDADGDTQPLPSAGQAATFIADDLATSSSVDRTVFAGSNKNNDAIGSWNWATGNVPVKDDLSNVYAYAAKSGSGDLIIYAGLERLSPNGDSHIDIEFNQNEVTLDQLLEVPPLDECGADQTAGAGDGPPCEFVTETNEKSENDFIVSLDYTRGGSLGSLEVRKFTGGNFVHVFTLQRQGCNLDADLPNPDNGDVICGFTNGAPIDGGPWPNFNSKGVATEDELPTNSFAEFGINITEVLGDELCFATFGVHTRSSASFTAELKDFAVGGFQVCEPNTSMAASVEVNYTFFETNTGTAPLARPDTPDNFVNTSGVTDKPHCNTLAEKVVPNTTRNVGDSTTDGTLGVLDPGETWQFICSRTFTYDPAAMTNNTPVDSVTFGTGHGIFDNEDTTFCIGDTAFEPVDTNGSPAEPNCDDDEQRTVTVKID